MKTYSRIGGPVLPRIYPLCWIKHRWVKSPPVQHWLSAGGERRAYDLGMRSCWRQCSRCGKDKRLDDCTDVVNLQPRQDNATSATIEAYMNNPDDHRFVIAPARPLPERRIKA